MEWRLATTLAVASLMTLLCGCESTSVAEKEAEAARDRRARSQKELADFERIQNAEHEIWTILDPLMREAANYNEREAFGYLGAAFATERFYDDRFRSEARSMGMGPFVSAVAVFPGSPAELAGLRVGDRVISINGDRLPRWDLAARYAVVKLKRAIKPGETNKLVVQRGGEKLSLKIDAEKAAYYATIVSPDAAQDLRSDGETIWISRQLAESLRGTGKLPYVCAYALAQNVMRHPERRRKKALMGGLLDAAAISTGIYSIGTLSNAGSKSFTRANASEADLIALYLLAATGHDISTYPDFWRDILTSQAAYGKLKRHDHERLLIMNKVIDSIERKRDAGRFIFPVEYLTGDESEIQLDRFAGVSAAESRAVPN